MGKIIICVDREIVLGYRNLTACTASTATPICYDLINYINAEIGNGGAINKKRYNDIIDSCNTSITISPDNVSTDIKTMCYVVPNDKFPNVKNPVISDYVLNHSSPLPAFCFYKNDRQLRDYENFFDDIGNAFVPLSVAVPYFTSMYD
jgi:hypothetical protein